jgi:ribosome-binding protein aMBF1 (putative translation factor)
MARVRTLTPDGDEIRARRLELALSPEQLAAKIGRHPQTIRRLEAGRIKKASELLIHQVALALGVKAKDITRQPNGVAA